MPRKRKRHRSSRHRVALIFIFGILLLLALVAKLALRASRKQPTSSNQKAPTSASPADVAVFASYGKSSSCEHCHQEQFELWQKSHHALAERPISPALDSGAF